MRTKPFSRVAGYTVLLLAVSFLVIAPENPYNVADAAETTATADSLESLTPLYQPYLTNIGPYKPVYFLLGADPKESRFQLSFKYQLFGNDSPLVARHPWVSGIHLGYTQTSSWDLKSDSAPFEDTSYMPEIFFATGNLLHRGGRLDGLFIQSGAQHESNGQAGEVSRSTNYVYASSIAVLYSDHMGMGCSISPKLVMFFNNSDSTNPDIDKYRGNVELEIKAGIAEGIVVGTMFRFAPKGTSVQLDATYPLSMSFFSNLNIYLHVQYVDALAETLLNYKDRTEAFRIGFSIVR